MTANPSPEHHFIILDKQFGSESPADKAAERKKAPGAPAPYPRAGKRAREGEEGARSKKARGIMKDHRAERRDVSLPRGEPPVMPLGRRAGV